MQYHKVKTGEPCGSTGLPHRRIRSQESGVTMKSLCFPSAAFCFLPSAFCAGVMSDAAIGPRPVDLPARASHSDPE